MKSRTLCIIFVLLTMVMVVIAGGSKKEELYGTWINEDIKGATPPTAIQVYKPDGTFQYFRLEAKSWEQEVEKNEEGWIHCYSGPYEIIEKWTDEEGNVWYKIEIHLSPIDKYFALIKINGSSNILEYDLRRIEFAEDINPNASTYGIYYRQE